MADRAWRAHEERAGDLVVERDLMPGHYDRPDGLWDWRRQLETEAPDRLGSALMLLVRMFTRRKGFDWHLSAPVAELLRRPFEVSDDDALLAARTAVRVPVDTGLTAYGIAEVMLGKRFGPTIADPAAQAAARGLVDALIAGPPDPGRRQMRNRVLRLLPADTTMIAPVDGWARDVLPRLADGSVDGTALAGLLAQLTAATGSKPGKSWAARTAEVVADPAARAALRVLVERLAEAEPVPTVMTIFEDVTQQVQLLLGDHNTDLVRAGLWATVSVPEPWVVPALLRIGLRAFDPAHTLIASPKVANAAIFALGRIGGPAGIAALSTLDKRNTGNDYRKRIAAAVAAAADAAGLSPGQALERMVDDGGLGPDGAVTIESGAVTGRVTLTADLTVTVEWRGATGWVARPPAGAAKPDVDAVRRLVRDLRNLVATERRRVEGLFAEDRDWDLAEWRRYYLDHPVTGRIAARLLWRFGDDTRLGGDAELPTTGRVRLWHPAGAGTEEVAAWRDHFVEHGLRQPAKQAFREVYPLTDAERETRIYSNRFAAHVLRYGQAYALFKERGWPANYLGPYDDGYEGRARREFRDAGLTAVFEHFPAQGDARGAPDLCISDRVWFHRTGDRAREPVVLTDVPPLVFSEAMRDVDLFVGVASIAQDPNWWDRGDQPFYTYWSQASLGELSARAEVRRDVLARILPRLAVADRVELTDRFVLVRGNLGTYRIHVGTANIVIEPDDRYLCIVPSRRRDPKVLLPFEGDEVLSVILSEVLLLVRDDRITDPTILSQLAIRPAR